MPALEIDFSPETFRTERCRAEALFGDAIVAHGQDGLRVLYDTKADVAELYFAVGPMESADLTTGALAFVDPHAVHAIAAGVLGDDLVSDASCQAWQGVNGAADAEVGSAPLTLAEFGTGTYELRLLIPAPGSLNSQQRLEMAGNFVGLAREVRVRIDRGLDDRAPIWPAAVDDQTPEMT